MITPQDLLDASSGGRETSLPVPVYGERFASPGPRWQPLPAGYEFEKPDPATRYQAPTGTERLANLGRRGYQYVQTPGQPSRLVVPTRESGAYGEMGRNKTKKLYRAGLPASYGEVSHELPHSLGGSMELENLALRDKPLHRQLTKVGEIANTLYQNPQAVKQLLGRSIDLPEAREMLVNWKGKDVSDVFLTRVDTGDLVTRKGTKQEQIELAVKKYKEWYLTEPSKDKSWGSFGEFFGDLVTHPWQTLKTLAPKNLKEVKMLTPVWGMNEVAKNIPSGTTTGEKMASEFGKQFQSNIALGHVPVYRDEPIPEGFAYDASRFAGGLSGSLAAFFIAGKILGPVFSKVTNKIAPMPKAMTAAEAAKAVSAAGGAQKAGVIASTLAKIGATPTWASTMPHRFVHLLPLFVTMGQIRKYETGDLEERSIQLLEDIGMTGLMSGLPGKNLLGAGTMVGTITTYDYVVKRESLASSLVNGATMGVMHYFGGATTKQLEESALDHLNMLGKSRYIPKGWKPSGGGPPPPGAPPEIRLGAGEKLAPGAKPGTPTPEGFLLSKYYDERLQEIYKNVRADKSMSEQQQNKEIIAETLRERAAYAQTLPPSQRAEFLAKESQALVEYFKRLPLEEKLGLTKEQLAASTAARPKTEGTTVLTFETEGKGTVETPEITKDAILNLEPGEQRAILVVTETPAEASKTPLFGKILGRDAQPVTTKNIETLLVSETGKVTPAGFVPQIEADAIVKELSGKKIIEANVEIGKDGTVKISVTKEAFGRTGDAQKIYDSTLADLELAKTQSAIDRGVELNRSRTDEIVTQPHSRGVAEAGLNESEMARVNAVSGDLDAASAKQTTEGMVDTLVTAGHVSEPQARVLAEKISQGEPITYGDIKTVSETPNGKMPTVTGQVGRTLVQPSAQDNVIVFTPGRATGIGDTATRGGQMVQLSAVPQGRPGGKMEGLGEYAPGRFTEMLSPLSPEQLKRIQRLVPSAAKRGVAVNQARERFTDTARKDLLINEVKTGDLTPEMIKSLDKTELETAFAETAYKLVRPSTESDPKLEKQLMRLRDDLRDRVMTGEISAPDLAKLAKTLEAISVENIGQRNITPEIEGRAKQLIREGMGITDAYTEAAKEAIVDRVAGFEKPKKSKTEKGVTPEKPYKNILAAAKRGSLPTEIDRGLEHQVTDRNIESGEVTTTVTPSVEPELSKVRRTGVDEEGNVKYRVEDTEAGIIAKMKHKVKEIKEQMGLGAKTEEQDLAKRAEKILKLADEGDRQNYLEALDHIKEADAVLEKPSKEADVIVEKLRASESSYDKAQSLANKLYGKKGESKWAEVLNKDLENRIERGRADLDIAKNRHAILEGNEERTRRQVYDEIADIEVLTMDPAEMRATTIQETRKIIQGIRTDLETFRNRRIGATQNTRQPKFSLLESEAVLGYKKGADISSTVPSREFLEKLEADAIAKAESEFEIRQRTTLEGESETLASEQGRVETPDFNTEEGQMANKHFEKLKSEGDISGTEAQRWSVYDFYVKGDAEGVKLDPELRYTDLNADHVQGVNELGQLKALVEGGREALGKIKVSDQSRSFLTRIVEKKVNGLMVDKKVKLTEDEMERLNLTPEQRKDAYKMIKTLDPEFQKQFLRAWVDGELEGKMLYTEIVPDSPGRVGDPLSPGSKKMYLDILRENIPEFDARMKEVLDPQLNEAKARVNDLVDKAKERMTQDELDFFKRPETPDNPTPQKLFYEDLVSSYLQKFPTVSLGEYFSQNPMLKEVIYKLSPEFGRRMTIGALPEPVNPQKVYIFGRMTAAQRSAIQKIPNQIGKEFVLRSMDRSATPETRSMYKDIIGQLDRQEPGWRSRVVSPQQYGETMRSMSSGISVTDAERFVLNLGFSGELERFNAKVKIAEASADIIALNDRGSGVMSVKVKELEQQLSKLDKENAKELKKIEEDISKANKNKEYEKAKELVDRKKSIKDPIEIKDLRRKIAQLKKPAWAQVKDLEDKIERYKLVELVQKEIGSLQGKQGTEEVFLTLRPNELLPKSVNITNILQKIHLLGEGRIGDILYKKFTNDAQRSQIDDFLMTGAENLEYLKDDSVRRVARSILEEQLRFPIDTGKSKVEELDLRDTTNDEAVQRVMDEMGLEVHEPVQKNSMANFAAESEESWNFGDPRSSRQVETNYTIITGATAEPELRDYLRSLPPEDRSAAIHKIGRSVIAYSLKGLSRQPAMEKLVRESSVEFAKERSKFDETVRTMGDLEARIKELQPSVSGPVLTDLVGTMQKATDGKLVNRSDLKRLADWLDKDSNLQKLGNPFNLYPRLADNARLFLDYAKARSEYKQKFGRLNEMKRGAGGERGWGRPLGEHKPEATPRNPETGAELRVEDAPRGIPSQAELKPSEVRRKVREEFDIRLKKSNKEFTVKLADEQRAEAARIETEISQKQKDLKDLENKIAEFEKNIPDLSKDPKYLELHKRYKAHLDAAIKNRGEIDVLKIDRKLTDEDSAALKSLADEIENMRALTSEELQETELSITELESEYKSRLEDATKLVKRISDIEVNLEKLEYEQWPIDKKIDHKRAEVERLREMGDISENFGLHQAREELAELYAKQASKSAGEMVREPSMTDKEIADQKERRSKMGLSNLRSTLKEIK